MKVRTKYLLLGLVILVVIMVWSTFSQPGITDLPGDFQEIVSAQNENNTGPVKRIYIVTLSDTLWEEMEAYGNYMPYAKLGTTTVWFFLNSQPYPTSINPGMPPFQPIYQAAAIARYEKNNMGTVTLTPYPFQP